MGEENGGIGICEVDWILLWFSLFGIIGVFRDLILGSWSFGKKGI